MFLVILGYYEVLNTYFGHFTISPKERITAKANISIINVTISQSYTFSLTYSVFP